MIDWYLILFVAITLLIFHMKEFGEHPEIGRFIQDRANIPVSTGTMQLLFRFMTGTFLFIPFYFTLEAGYMGGLILALSGIIAFFLFRIQIARLSKKLPSNENRHSFLKRKFSKRGYYTFHTLMLIAGFEGLIIGTLLVSEFFYKVFGFSPIHSVIPVLFFSYIYAGMGGIGGIRKIGIWQIMLFFAGLAILPLSFFLINGAKQIYAALETTGMAQIQFWPLFTGAILFIPVIYGHLMTYFTVNNDLISIKANRGKFAVGLGAVCWSSITLSISLTVFYLSAVTKSTAVSRLLASSQEHIPVLFLYVLVFVILSSCTMGIGLSLYGITSQLAAIFSERLTVKKAYLGSFLFCLATIALVIWIPGAFKPLFMFFINVFAALGFPLWLLVTYEIRWGMEFSAAVVTSFAIGTWASFIIGWQIGVSFSFGISALLISISFIRNIRKI